MKRRDLLKILGVSAVGLVSVPLWIDYWDGDDLPPNQLGMPEDQQLLLKDLVETIIPKTDIPGAQDLQVDKFVVTMVADCYEKQVRDEFLNGFKELQNSAEKTYKSDFLKIKEEEKNTLLTEMAEKPVPENQKINFITFLKGLTITGYMTSEYVEMNHLHYEMVPGRFYGSFPVSKSKFYNA
ncbi:gluconate 2-dehydrogenase subunit 3 family protein [Christiangramia fulva]|nr:gluconate 2-dehydrogenase subunit 3 family protein [Christiangramia fulva]